MSNNNLICALSGDSPIPDPVCTPTGQICSKRLLLSKLTETNGINPFTTTSTTLDESQLIDLTSTTTSTIQPPKLPTLTSIPSLLSTLQTSYDTLVLELYDTRKALEETRRELSESLYQNDAAVRVVARVVLERDLARRQVMEVVATGGSGVVEGGGGKRRRTAVYSLDVVPVVEEEMEDVPAAVAVTPTTESTEPTTSETDGSETTTVIPANQALQLETKWKELSANRKKTTKAKKKRDKLRQSHQAKDGTVPKELEEVYATMETLNEWECTQTKNLHKASYKAGVLGMNGTMPTITDPDSTTTTPNAVLVTSARDKQLIFYDIPQHKIVHKEALKTTVPSNCLDSFVDVVTGEKVVACVGDDGIVRVFATAAGGEWDTVLSCHLSLQSTVEGVKEEPTNVVGVVIHPTGRHVFVVTSNGKIHFLSITKQKSEEGGEELQIAIAATFEDTSAAASEVECSCISLHPDGLILAIGRSDGQVALWDLKTQQLASVLEGSTESKITALSFSENGYHVATSAIDGAVTIWDLRKQSIIASLSSTTTGNDEGGDAPTTGNTKEVHSLAFCPSGKYLAYGTSNGEIILSLVGKGSANDESKMVVLKSKIPPGTPTKRKKKGKAAVNAGPGNVCGLVWGDDAQSLVSINDSERGVSFWGSLNVKDP